MKMKDKIIIIAGFSGAGKDTIANLIAQQGYNFVVSHTNRPKRDYEVDGGAYHFVDKEFMLTEPFIEIRSYDTVDGEWIYGIHENAIKDNKPYVVIMDLDGALVFKNLFGSRVKIVFLEVYESIRLQRALNRSKTFSYKEWTRRLADDIARFNDDKISKCDFIFDNNNTNPINLSTSIVNVVENS